MDMPPGVLPPEDRKLLEQGDDLHAVTNARAYFKTHGAAVWQRRQSRTLKRILRDGLPDEYRGEAWLTLGEAGEAGGCEHEAQIDKDVTRTGVASMGAEQLSSLRRILQAVARHVPSVGYCQSMNIICAVLIQHLDEEEAFWVLVRIVRDLLPDYYTPSMLGLRVDSRVFAALVSQYLPDVAVHLAGLGASVPLISFQWFLCLFAGVTQPEVTARAWDNIFLHGVPFLHRLGMALLQESRSQVLAQSDVADVVVVIRSVAESLEGASLFRRTTRFDVDSGIVDDLRARFREDIAEEELQFERASRAQPSGLPTPVPAGDGAVETAVEAASGEERDGAGAEPSPARPLLRGRRRPTLVRVESAAGGTGSGSLRSDGTATAAADAIASPLGTATHAGVDGGGGGAELSHGKERGNGSFMGGTASPLFVQVSPSEGEAATAAHTATPPAAETEANGSGDPHTGVHVGLPQLRALHRELMTLLRRNARRSAHGPREACCVGLDRRAFTELWRLAATRAGVDVGRGVPGQLFDAFSMADGPGEGAVVDVREVLCGLVVLCPADRFAKLRFCFTVYDTDDSGSLEREELLDLMYAVFGLFFDSEVSEEVERFVASVFAHMDADQDGCISMDEFREVALMQPLIFRFFSLASSRGQHPRARMLRSLVANGSSPQEEDAAGPGSKALPEPRAEQLGEALRATEHFQAAERLAADSSDPGAEDAGRLVGGVGELVAYARDLEARLAESRVAYSAAAADASALREELRDVRAVSDVNKSLLHDMLHHGGRREGGSRSFSPSALLARMRSGSLGKK